MSLRSMFQKRSEPRLRKATVAALRKQETKLLAEVGPLRALARELSEVHCCSFPFFHRDDTSEERSFQNLTCSLLVLILQTRLSQSHL